MNMNPAPPKPPKTADRKAWTSFYSELRRWAQALEQWEADLDEREAAFEQAVEEVSDETVQQYAGIIDGRHRMDADVDQDDDDCDCDDEAAAAGCDCPKCENIRQEWLKISKEQKTNTKTTDELNQLEALWKLEDKRT